MKLEIWSPVFGGRVFLNWKEGDLQGVQVFREGSWLVQGQVVVQIVSHFESVGLVFVPLLGELSGKGGFEYYSNLIRCGPANRILEGVEGEISTYLV